MSKHFPQFGTVDLQKAFAWVTATKKILRRSKSGRITHDDGLVQALSSASFRVTKPHDALDAARIPNDIVMRKSQKFRVPENEAEGEDRPSSEGRMPCQQERPCEASKHLHMERQGSGWRLVPVPCPHKAPRESQAVSRGGQK